MMKSTGCGLAPLQKNNNGNAIFRLCAFKDQVSWSSTDDASLFDTLFRFNNYLLFHVETKSIPVNV